MEKCNTNHTLPAGIADYNSAIMHSAPDHSRPPLKVILFDFGSTLIYSKDPWPPIYEMADRVLFETLRQTGIQIDASAFARDFDTFLGTYYDERGAGIIEKTTPTLLAELLAQKGFAAVPASTIRKALDAMYALTQQNWYLEEDALPTLTALRETDYRLGMISNTSDDDNVQQLLDRWRLRPFFEDVVTSAGCGIRKPDPRIFHLALDHFQTPPQQVVMVGDTPEADILGANQVGMYSIWITRRVPNSDPSPAHPSATVRTLGEIPAIIKTLS
jgi:HAD superfamily hydrolase (TIGR01662 family)